MFAVSKGETHIYFIPIPCRIANRLYTKVTIIIDTAYNKVHLDFTTFVGSETSFMTSNRLKLCTQII